MNVADRRTGGGTPADSKDRANAWRRAVKTTFAHASLYPVMVSFQSEYGQCLNCEKEVAERWKRGAKGGETNAEGVRIEAPRGGEWGGAVPSPTD